MSSIPDFQPLYRQVYEVLVRRIAEGTWRPGQTLPSEQALAAELGVSQGTVRKAMDSLAAENLILRRQGKGSFVAEHTQEHALFRFFRLARPSPDREPVTPQLGPTRVHSRAASRIERQRLRLAEGADVIEIRRTRLVDETPAINEKIILPTSLFPGIERQEALPNTLYSLYQNVYGISIAFAREELSAVLADKRDAAALDIPVGSPLLQIDRIGVALDGRRVEWRTSRCDTRNLVYAVDVT
jgi:GntR family transcriptional regulator